MSPYVRARPDPPDRRFNPRCVTNVRGEVVLPGGDRLACLVRDVSLRGARLVFDQAPKLPIEFELIIGLNGRARPVRTVWYEGRQVGVVRTTTSDT